MLLVSLPVVQFMELKDFKGVLWNRPSRCIIKQNRNVLCGAVAEVSCCNVLLGCQIGLVISRSEPGLQMMCLCDKYVINLNIVI